ncbi:MAG TPA: phosphohistidine phosphatase [Micrococcales bacterium]|uniref:Histidine phosphatase family protein n=1 Tax=Miniimonas arenae TaxID=676201 RepID=A0A5C5BG18_9MICO|nr:MULTISPECIES: histidine phosphatase family protein [Miniimonas]TNU76644.1 histidine phosphatase family protein [Miniimonas arenae]HCX84465.1 phosphohistidine phosphatase [Micrococcales bacterium]
MPTLVLLRHAKAEPHAASDAARPLALRGRRQAAAVGDALAADGPVPDLVLVSAATRTRQTWELLAARLPVRPDVAVLEELYDAGPRTVLSLLRGVDDAVGTVLVVGHEPVMSSTAALLASADSDEHLLDAVHRGVPTAARSVLELDAGWAALDRGTARLVAVERAVED